MKWTSTILSIIFLLLSCLPCADKDMNSSSQILVVKSSSEHNQDNDACSPFCICNCCSSHVFAFDNTVSSLDFVIVQKLVKNKIPEYKSVFTSNFFGSIWQPPQIV
ncbi:MAG TPA: DUF6660 family protein [Flavobacterium sp.]|uniref:DUF6660 family protein n=1 Tax=Flavobacterium sp. TaxID=239 RepID=UPI002DBE73B9|nr:DUF6660 family protein [Flavobacterium sp.]HEU4788616.1 DUF6660 family protein [Flavobacterium sp.]